MTPANDAPMTVEPDWLNADVCIENMQIAYDDATEDEDEMPVDTVVSAGDLGVLIGLAQYAVRHRLAALASAPAGKLDRDYTARRMKELMDEGDGFWRACSGCQEGEDGYVSEKDYPFDPLFRCQPGGGCSECGGIGVLWDDGHGYDDITGDEEPASAPAGDGVVKECQQCDGEGEHEHPHMPVHTLQSECPEYAVVTCDECHGTGSIPVEEPGDYLRDRMLSIATICEGKGLLIEASGLRDIASIVSEQFKKWIAR